MQSEVLKSVPQLQKTCSNKIITIKCNNLYKSSSQFCPNILSTTEVQCNVQLDGCTTNTIIIQLAEVMSNVAEDSVQRYLMSLLCQSEHCLSGKK